MHPTVAQVESRGYVSGRVDDEVFERVDLFHSDRLTLTVSSDTMDSYGRVNLEC